MYNKALLDVNLCNHVSVQTMLSVFLFPQYGRILEKRFSWMPVMFDFDFHISVNKGEVYLTDSAWLNIFTGREKIFNPPSVHALWKKLLLWLTGGRDKNIHLFQRKSSKAILRMDFSPLSLILCKFLQNLTSSALHNLGLHLARKGKRGNQSSLEVLILYEIDWIISLG